MNIVIDARLINASGIGRYLRELIPLFISDFDEVVLIGEAKFLRKYAGCQNVIIREFRFGVYSLIGQFLLPFLIKKCDVFWSPHFSSTFLPVFAKKRITTIHDVFHIANREYYSNIQFNYARFLYKLALYYSDKIITVSNFTKNEIIKYFNCKKEIEVIYNGVDTESFRLKSDNVPNVIKDFNHGKFLLCVGNVKPHKNIKVVIQAFRELNKINTEINLVIVGKIDGFIKGDKEQLKEQIDNVFFTGYISDEQLVYLYQNADAFIFPSLYEGFGLPPLEGLAAGTRVIVSNRHPMREICKEFVEYFDPLNPNSLVDVIIRNQTISNVDVDSFLASFSWHNSRILHSELFNDII